MHFEFEMSHWRKEKKKISWGVLRSDINVMIRIMAFIFPPIQTDSCANTLLRKEVSYLWLQIQERVIVIIKHGVFHTEWSMAIIQAKSSSLSSSVNTATEI